MQNILEGLDATRCSSLSDSPLELFQIQSAGLSLDSRVTDELWTQLILTENAPFDSPYIGL